MNNHSAHEDTNFDLLAERFEKRIYGNIKGDLRLAILWRDIQDNIVEIQSKKFKVWDAGGGLGQISQKLHRAGHQVLLTDISSEMLSRAPAELIKRQASIQTIAGEHPSFDLLLCHAVLEWVAEPFSIISSLYNCLDAGRYCSLMFYNKQALVLRNLIKGNYRLINSGNFAGQKGGLTPHSALEPTEVISYCEELGFELVSKRGIRLAYDLLRKEHAAERSFEDLFEMEWRYGADEPFWHLGRYVHLVLRKI